MSTYYVDLLDATYKFELGDVDLATIEIGSNKFYVVQDYINLAIDILHDYTKKLALLNYTHKDEGIRKLCSFILSI